MNAETVGPRLGEEIEVVSDFWEAHGIPEDMRVVVYNAL